MLYSRDNEPLYREESLDVSGPSKLEGVCAAFELASSRITWWSDVRKRSLGSWISALACLELGTGGKKADLPG